jgi:ankyrin repeat protein
MKRKNEDLDNISQAEIAENEEKKQKKEFLDIEFIDEFALQVKHLLEHNDPLQIQEFFNSKDKILKTFKWEKEFFDDYTMGYSNILHFLAYIGDDGLLEIIIKNAKKFISPEVNILEIKDDCDNYPLFYAAMKGHQKVVELLLDKGANVNAFDSAYYTALFYAARIGHEGIIKLLLNNGANINAVNDYKDSALIEAIRNGHEGIVMLLLDKGANVNADDGEHTAFAEAIINGHEGLIKLFLDKGADLDAANYGCGNTALMLAAQFGRVSVVEAFIKHGAEVNTANEKTGETALILAARNGHASVAEVLVKAGAIVDKANEKTGVTALTIAALSGCVPVVEALIKHGAEVNKANERTEGTPLTCAVEKGHASVVEALIKHGAKVNKANEKNGITPLMLAAGLSKITLQNSNKQKVPFLGINQFLEIPAYIYNIPSDEAYCEVVKALLKTHKIDLSCKDKAGKDALQYAKEAGLAEVEKDINLYKAFHSILKGNNNKLGLLEIMVLEQKEADFKFIEELTYSYLFKDCRELKAEDMNKIISTLIFDLNIINGVDYDSYQLKNCAKSYNLAVETAKKQFEAYVESKKSELCRLEKILVQTYYDDDLAEIIEENSKPGAVKKEAGETAAPQGILGLSIDISQEGGITKYKSCSETYGGNILEKFLEKIELGTKQDSNLLLPLLMNNDHFNQFALYFNLIKPHLPNQLKAKGESFIKLINEEKAKPTFEVLVTMADNNHYLKEQVTKLEEQVTKLEAKQEKMEVGYKALQEQNNKLLGFMESFAQLLSDNGIKGADKLLKEVTGSDHSMDIADEHASSLNSEILPADADIKTSGDIDSTMYDQ